MRELEAPFLSHFQNMILTLVQTLQPARSTPWNFRGASLPGSTSNRSDHYMYLVKCFIFNPEVLLALMMICWLNTWGHRV